MGLMIKFVGGIESTTGSCTWLKYNQTETEFLVDCGIFQDQNNIFLDNNTKKFPFKPDRIKFVLLTHAHLDHCGLIPRLYDEGFVGSVICTRATAEITQKILLDASKIDAPYNTKSISKVRFYCIDDKLNFKWGIFSPIDKDIYICFFRSSHILGSVSISINAGKSKNNKIIHFSGDIGNNTSENSYQSLLKKRHTPRENIDLIILESTYGNRCRESSYSSFENRINFLEKVIEKTIYNKRGKLIIPAFSLHRSQDILFDIYYILKYKWNGRNKYHFNLTKDQLISGISKKLFEAWILNNNNIDQKIKEYLENCLIPVASKISSKNFPKIINMFTLTGDKEIVLSSYKADGQK